MRRSRIERIPRSAIFFVTVPTSCTADSLRSTDWYVADALHFPFRSLEQYLQKGLRQAHGEWRLGQYVRAFHAHEQGRVESAFRSLVVDDAMVERGLANGALVEDTRLRDALRAPQRAGQPGLGRRP